MPCGSIFYAKTFVIFGYKMVMVVTCERRATFANQNMTMRSAGGCWSSWGREEGVSCLLPSLEAVGGVAQGALKARHSSLLLRLELSTLEVPSSMSSITSSWEKPSSFDSVVELLRNTGWALIFWIILDLRRTTTSVAKVSSLKVGNTVVESICRQIKVRTWNKLGGGHRLRVECLYLRYSPNRDSLRSNCFDQH